MRADATPAGKDCLGETNILEAAELKILDSVGMLHAHYEGILPQSDPAQGPKAQKQNGGGTPP